MKPEFRNSITDSSCHAVSLGWRANAANQSSPAAFLFCLISSLSCSAQLLCHSSFSYQKRERYVLLSGLMLVHFSFIYARIYILWYLKTSFPSVTNARQYHFPLSQASALHVNRRTECWQIFVYFSFKSIFFFLEYQGFSVPRASQIPTFTSSNALRLCPLHTFTLRLYQS
jgi:hypothetical protein